MPSIKTVSCGLVLAASLAVVATDACGAETPEKLDVYLLIGQSNMAGRAPIPEDATGAIPNCYLLSDKDQWEPASNPLNRYSTVRKTLKMQKLGPGYGFALAMLAEKDATPIGLVVNARGGSNIDEWEPEDKYYREAVRRAKIAQQSGTLRGIVWHQGEANASDPKYSEKLQALVANLRKDLGSPELPFVCGGVAGDRPVNARLAALPKQVPGTGFASSEGLTTLEGVHFDSKSAILLGQRYAAQMKAILARQK